MHGKVCTLSSQLVYKYATTCTAVTQLQLSCRGDVYFSSYRELVTNKHKGMVGHIHSNAKNEAACTTPISNLT